MDKETEYKHQKMFINKNDSFDKTRKFYLEKCSRCTHSLSGYCNDHYRHKNNMEKEIYLNKCIESKRLDKTVYNNLSNQSNLSNLSKLLDDKTNIILINSNKKLDNLNNNEENYLSRSEPIPIPKIYQPDNYKFNYQNNYLDSYVMNNKNKKKKKVTYAKSIDYNDIDNNINDKQNINNQNDSSNHGILNTIGLSNEEFDFEDLFR